MIQLKKVLKARTKEKNTVISQARKYALRLQKVLGPLTALLYGSYARGDFNLGSDIDVLIISDALPEHPLKRSELLYRYINPGLEPKGYTWKEFRKMLEKGNPIVREAIDKGILLLGDKVN